MEGEFGVGGVILLCGRAMARAWHYGGRGKKASGGARVARDPFIDKLLDFITFFS